MSSSKYPSGDGIARIGATMNQMAAQALVADTEKRIVEWLRSNRWGDWNGTYANDVLADAIERGEHNE